MRKEVSRWSTLTLPLSLGEGEGEMARAAREAPTVGWYLALLRSCHRIPSIENRLEKRGVWEMTLRIGIVGLGGIGNIHARCYKENPNTEVVAVCDIIRERADKAAEAYGAKAFYSVQEMLASGIRLDACSMGMTAPELTM